MSSACISEVKHTTDADESEVQKTESSYRSSTSTVLRGQARMIQLCKKTVEFPNSTTL